MLRWFMVALLALVTTRCTLSPAFAQGILPASTGCVNDTTALTLYRPDILKDSLAFGEMDAHESVHRIQLDSAMKTGKTCFEVMMEFNESFQSNLAIEAPAYQAQAKWDAEHWPLFDSRDFYMVMATALYFDYNKSIPLPEILIKLYKEK